MGEIVPVQPVTPILGAIYRDSSVVEELIPALTKLLGGVDLISDEYPFDLTSHYQAEMGTDLRRRFYCFGDLADPALLADWKICANRLEEQAAGRAQEARPVNLDPGYLTGAKLVLASVKGLGHRVYIGRGIHAEVTMSYRDGRWIKRDYTFPDFKSGRYDAFFSAARNRHLELLAATV